MKNVLLEKAYDPASFEARLYNDLNERGAYKPDSQCKGSPFSVVMPPPNVTGVLHMGHALNITLQDILVRYHRMAGRKTLWVPGTDHAGIATQHVVEKELLKEGKKRTDLTREEFVERTWSLKKRHHDIIVSQIKSMDASCDWEHERFTLDEGLSRAVRECFVKLYDKGMIYQGEYLVNYCPHCMTALSDDEVEAKPVDSFFWSITYPYADEEGGIVVATTRPETLFGDSAVAVNPKDKRYKKLVGKKVKLPLTNRTIEIIEDSFVSLEEGSGMVKITPAHDPNDKACGERHNLEIINILNPDGTLNGNVPEKYRGMDVLTARKAVVADLEAAGLIVKTEPITHNVGHCYRCGTAIEPYMSKQWFVKMKGMAEKALKALRDGQIVFHPAKWASTYENWMKNIKDWCISRQLWWGHRIPVWYCNDCGAVTVSVDDASECCKCGSKNIHQDSDVLDTWFSSWLWPFSVMGWPDETADLAEYYPTSTLVTAYDIIFFWVSRMIMAGLEFTGKAPFRDIYITSLVRDMQGRKMSKSLGNGIDPLEVVKLYGSDAMKFTLAFQAAQGQDILIDMDSFKFGSKFANKIWNASRYILMNLEDRKFVDMKSVSLNVFDRWILDKFNKAVEKSKSAYAEFRINDASQIAYEFFWNDFCDWYVEFSKKGLYSDDGREKDKTISVLLVLLERVLRLLHPLLPMVTEEIYSKLPEKFFDHGRPLVGMPYPQPEEIDDSQVALVESLKEVVKSLRNLRTVLNLPAGAKCDASIVSADEELVNFLKQNEVFIHMFASIENIEFKSRKDQDVIYSASSNFMCGIKRPDDFDLEGRKAALEKERDKVQADLEKSKNKLENEDFIKRAKESAVNKEKEKLGEFTRKLANIESVLKILVGK